MGNERRSIYGVKCTMPDKLRLVNAMTNTAYVLTFDGEAPFKWPDVSISDKTTVLGKTTVECLVAQAWHLVRPFVRIKEASEEMSEILRESAFELYVDRILDEPEELTRVLDVPVREVMAGAEFNQDRYDYGNKYVFQARLDSEKPIGLFLPNGSVIEAFIKLARRPAADARITVEAGLIGAYYGAVMK